MPDESQTEANPLGGTTTAQVDSWLSIDPRGSVTVYLGKVELGTGIETAFTQLVADELDVPLGAVTIVQGITGVTPDQGYTAGSQSIQTGSLISPVREGYSDSAP